MRVGPDGSLTLVAGTGCVGFSGDGGPAGRAQLNEPRGLALDPTGSLYIADAANHCVRQVTPEGMITTVAGTGTPGFSGDGGRASMARLDRPMHLTVDGQGSLFIVDSLNGRVRKVGRDGVITTVFSARAEVGGGATMPYYPAWVAVDGEGNLLVVDPFLHHVFPVPGVAAPQGISEPPCPEQ